MSIVSFADGHVGAVKDLIFFYPEGDTDIFAGFNTLAAPIAIPATTFNGWTRVNAEDANHTIQWVTSTGMPTAPSLYVRSPGGNYSEINRDMGDFAGVRQFTMVGYLMCGVGSGNNEAYFQIKDYSGSVIASITRTGSTTGGAQRLKLNNVDIMAYGDTTTDAAIRAFAGENVWVPFSMYIFAGKTYLTMNKKLFIQPNVGGDQTRPKTLYIKAGGGHGGSARLDEVEFAMVQ
jgi:hypothetical protein